METAINVAQSCAHLSDTDRRVLLVEATDTADAAAAITAGARLANIAGGRGLALVADGASVALVLDSPLAPRFVDLAMKCNAVLCCRLSPIQKAKVISETIYLFFSSTNTSTGVVRPEIRERERETYLHSFLFSVVQNDDNE